jgi:hypothetical protein
MKSIDMFLRAAILLFFAFMLSVCPGKAQVRRQVLVEDFTGIWCGDCPVGRSAMDHLEEKFGSSVICIGMHSTDSLSNPYSDGVVNQCNVTEFPLAFVDRASFASLGGVFQVVAAPTDLDVPVGNRIATKASVGVSVNSSYDAVTRKLTATVQADFAEPAPGNFRISCLLVEDSIPTNNQQLNNNDNNPDSPWYHQGNPLRVYFQRNVARVNLADNIWGDNPDGGENGRYSKSYEFTLPPSWRADQIKLVGFVSESGGSATVPDTAHFSVLNACIANLHKSAVQTVKPHAGFSSGNAYPSPFSDQTTIPVNVGSDNTRVQWSVYSSDGTKVSDLGDEVFAAGDYTFHWTGTNSEGLFFPSGIYFIRITSTLGSDTHPVLLIR